jgi:Fe-S oxidoreductase
MAEGGAAQYLDDVRARSAAIAEACTRCGACFEACPMTGPGGLGGADPSATAAGIIDLITGGDGSETARRWAAVCTGSGYCIPACPEGINARFMVQLARSFARRGADAAAARTRGRDTFATVTQGIRVLSRLQLDPETLARLRGNGPAPRRTRPPDVVFYTGCNVLKTPHIPLLCLDVLELLGIDYEVMGGAGQCCGVYQYREGDFETNAKIAYATIDGLASAGTSTVLSWCPSCQVQIGEVSMANYEARFGHRPFDLNPFLVFLAGHADRLARLMKHRVERRVALHERPAFPETMESVRTLLAIIPGVELVDIDVPRLGVQANTLAVLPAYKRELVERELAAVAGAGVDTLATIYHACHREICHAGDGRRFEVVNFMEILGEGLGLHHDDLYKRFKLMQDVDAIVAETSALAAQHGLGLEEVRDVLLKEFGG